MARTLIKGGTIVTSVDTYAADVLIEDGRIAAIFDPKVAPAGPFDVTIDATGKYIMPGGIDAHTHMDMPFGGTTASDDFETGTRAAVHGGTTTIVDFAIQAKGEALRKGLDTWHAKAEGDTDDGVGTSLDPQGVGSEAAKPGAPGREGAGADTTGDGGESTR